MSMTIKLELGYADGDTRSYSIRHPNDNYDSDFISHMKTRIAAFNEAAGTENSAVKKTFISDGGSPTTGIVGAEIVVVSEEVIFNG